MNLLQERFQETVVNLISNEKYVDLSFYGFIIAKLNVKYVKNMPTAGVKFNKDSLNYDLMIGQAFSEWSLEERIAVLIHECRHILGLHTIRKGERDHQLFNVATDISINQLIKNIPEGGVFPETFDFPKNESAETYYELLKEEKEKQEQSKKEYEENEENEEDNENSENEGDSQEDSSNSSSGWKPDKNSKGETKPDLTSLDSEPQTLDVHDWDGEGSSDEGVEELQKSLTENMVKEAMEQTRGNLPQDIEKILDFLKKKAKISWKKELRKILSSRNGTRIETIKRKNRRFPHRADLRGRKVQKDKPIVFVGVDASGSMDDEDVLNGLVEANEVIKNVGKLKLIQIDTEIKGTQDFDKNNFKRFKRKGYGGTYMGACPEYIEKNRLKCDVLIMISDMWIEDIPSDNNWKKFKKPVLWLSTSGEIPEILKHHKIFNIKDI